MNKKFSALVPAPIDFPRQVGDAVTRLKPTEKKILLILAESEPQTFYTLRKKKAATEGALLRGLKNLTSNGLISRVQEEGGRRRIFYRLTMNGFLIVLGLEEIGADWANSEILNNIAQMHKKKLPLIFGKLDFYREKGLDYLILNLLKAFANEIMLDYQRQILPEIDTPSTNSPESAEMFSSDVWREIIEQYPEFMKSLNDPCQILTEKVLILSGLLSTPKNMMSSSMSILYFLSVDEEIHTFIADYFTRMTNAYEATKERLEWWKDYWYGTRQAHLEESERLT